MDIRMFGPGYEEMYREAKKQKYNKFISSAGVFLEASLRIDGRVTDQGRYPLRDARCA